MGVMAPRSSCLGEDGRPLQGFGRHPVQRETKILSQVGPHAGAFLPLWRRGWFRRSSPIRR
jgi:hypothetical protein